MVDGTLRPVGIVDFETIATGLEVVTHGFQADGRLTRHDGHGGFVAVHTGADKIVGGVVTDFLDDIGDNV